MVLRYCSGEAVPRPERHLRTGDLWLGNDSGKCSDRQNRVEDLLMAQRWPLHWPINTSVRKAENLEMGDEVTVELEVR